MTALSEESVEGVDAGTRVRRRAAAALPGAAAVAVPSVALLAHVAYYGPWIEDDAGITFAYARSVASGLGPVLQPGASPVEGFSDPSWLALLVVGRWIGVFDHGSVFGMPDIVFFPKMLAMLCCIGIFTVFYRVLEDAVAAPVRGTWIAGTALACIPSFVIWTTSGLENALLALCVVSIAGVAARAVHRMTVLETSVAIRCGSLAALAGLTRPDGLIFGFAYPVILLFLVDRGRIRPALRSAGFSVLAFIAIIGAYELYRIHEFGDWLPNTARAKMQGIPGPSDLSRPAELISYAGWFTVIIIVVGAAIVMSRRRDVCPLLVTLLVPLGLAVAAFATLKPDWMAQYRFATPVWPLLVLIATICATSLVSTMRGRPRFILASAAAVALVLSVTAWVGSASDFHDHPTAPICYVAQDTGLAINTYADVLGVRGGSMLAVDGGGTALTSRLAFVDLAGLTNRPIARFWQNDDMVGLRDYVFDDVRPTFMKFWVGWLANTAHTGLLADPRLDRDYVLIWSREPGTATWVRREAVFEPSTLSAVQGMAPRIDESIRRSYQNSSATDVWPCAMTLRPGSYAPRRPS